MFHLVQQAGGNSTLKLAVRDSVMAIITGNLSRPPEANNRHGAGVVGVWLPGGFSVRVTSNVHATALRHLVPRAVFSSATRRS